MATVKLVPSTYTRSNSTYVVVTDPANMYYDTSHTANYASIRGRGGRSSNTTYYCYIRGFDFSSVPANAVVNSFNVKIRCYRNSYVTTGPSYKLRLTSAANTSSVISNTTASLDIGTSVSVITIPTGSITWSQLVGWGSDFSIQIRLRNNSTSSSNYPYVYVYGAEIEVDYSIVEGPADIYSNYYIMTSYGGWSPCIQGNTANGLLPFSGSVLPNCVGYAVGRFNEMQALGACTWLGSVNANQLVALAQMQGLATGSTPEVGACICWDDGVEGHAAIVEQVIDADTIVTTESGWNYSAEPIVRQYTRTRGLNGNWGYSGTFQAFIHPRQGALTENDYYIIWLEDE